MNTQKYLKRINVNEKMEVSLELLKHIQKQHLISVPFENLDIHLNNNLNTDIDSLYKKIVLEKRGGICYELNGSLYYLLKNLGFDVKLLGGKVEENGTFYDHMLLLIILNKNEYLVDVGFGDNFLEPLRFVVDRLQRDQKGSFKIFKIDSLHYKLMRFLEDKSDFETQYIFKNEGRNMNAFSNRRDYYVHSDESMFKKNLFSSLEQEQGRISLKHDKFISTEKGIRKEEAIDSQNQYIYYLKNELNIYLDTQDAKKMKDIWQVKSKASL